MRKTAIPDSCTFAAPDLFITKKGAEVFLDLCKKADDRNQDLHGLYIYNDFTNYGLLDLMQKTLSSIHHKIVKKDMDEAYSLLEALVAFAIRETGWDMVDDGECVEATHKALGALLINVIRNLKKQDRLDLEHFPTLPTFLKNVVELGEWMAGNFEDMGRYDHVYKAIAFRLLNGREEEQTALDKSRVSQWLSGMSSSDRREIRQALKEAEAEQGRNDWWKDGETYDEDEKHPDFAMVRVWKEYRDQLEGQSLLPFYGPPEWDLNKWTDEEKKKFRLSRPVSPA